MFGVKAIYSDHSRSGQVVLNAPAELLAPVSLAETTELLARHPD